MSITESLIYFLLANKAVLRKYHCVCQVTRTTLSYGPLLLHLWFTHATASATQLHSSVASKSETSCLLPLSVGISGITPGVGESRMFSLFFSLPRNRISLCLNVLGSNVFLRYITLHVSRLVYALTIASGLNFFFYLMITKLRNGLYSWRCTHSYWEASRLMLSQGNQMHGKIGCK